LGKKAGGAVAAHIFEEPMKSARSDYPKRSMAASRSNDFLRISRSRIHGAGAYAQRDIPAGTYIIEYVGPRIDKNQAARQCEAGNTFVFTVDGTWDIDGSVSWNPARFINHSCEPNCEAELDEEKGEVWIKALRNINAGEELTYNYGYGIEDFEEHPCRCGASECVGYMIAEEHFDKIRHASRVKARR
jgi:SET domain-containing protein